MLVTFIDARMAGVPVPLKFTQALTLFVGMAAVTKAVVAICVVLVPPVAVGAVGVPVRAGEASGAKPAMDAPVGMVTVPVKVGLAKGAAPETSATARVTAPVRPATEVTGAAGALARTKAVVAICVVFVPSVAVGAVGVPVKVGLAKGA
jgi:hypothetical protein